MDALNVQLRMRMETSGRFLRLNGYRNAIRSPKNSTFCRRVASEEARTMLPTSFKAVVAIWAVYTYTHAEQMLTDQ